MSERLTRVYRAAALALSAAALVACSTTQATGRPKAPAAATRPAPSADVLSQRSPDDIFVQLREAARTNDAARATALAAMLTDYDVPSYVQYFQIKPRMFDRSGKALLDTPDDEIRAFLRTYEGQAIADRMRNDWLLVLGKRHDWQTFDAEYPKFVLDDDTQVKCYALMSRAARGENVTQAATDLLTTPKHYGEGCVDMINTLAANGQLPRKEVWHQIRLAYEENYTSLGKQIADALGSVRPDDSLLDMAASRPAQLLSRGVDGSEVSRQLALLATVRMARSDAMLAASNFSSIAGNLSQDERAIGWGAIGMRGALAQTPMAINWYRQAGNAKLSNTAQEWKIRAALRAGDWNLVRTGIEAMPQSLRDDGVWTYWYGRALREAGQGDAARAQFQKIASQPNFYGQLANEELGNKTALPPRTTVTRAEIDANSVNPGFRRAAKFYDLGLRFEGNREWNWELRNMTDRQLLAAAQYANRIELFDRAVNTADRTKVEHDFTLRYLMPFRDKVEPRAAAVDLDEAWAYGLIRQESRFIINARSSAGAGGLMQIMPATAKMVAKQIGMDYQPAMMHDIDTNIRLGTRYLADIYNKFDGSAVLASAGYNAGPGRPRTWRSTLDRPVEGAIFAETIPFNETRQYVENVLSNTAYYATLITGRPQSLKERLGIILPQ
ncbi:lytic transglycosylase domain-containing protein [Pandoraea pulmonicola]|uniref:Lytic transglycosylase n=1 Tax=Pandoraea pulmonicola TaxID=93221 RepID=A0AAJ5D0I8_PANPU|nr:lytic transglycosylase domain-containing protein [Pandoraea pulmonicola]AJC20704.1 lytic transglycosylase [Pandoraea pulmonicola]SUA90786.1 Soluble lytic murein transglycosylase precursor [Pandoraea pulmonicola]